MTGLEAEARFARLGGERYEESCRRMWFFKFGDVHLGFIVGPYDRFDVQIERERVDEQGEVRRDPLYNSGVDGSCADMAFAHAAIAKLGGHYVVGVGWWVFDNCAVGACVEPSVLYREGAGFTLLRDGAEPENDLTAEVLVSRLADFAKPWSRS